MSHKKRCYDPSNVNMESSFMDFKYQPCGIFEGISHPNENKSIATATFSEYKRPESMINRPYFSNITDMMISVSVIFETASTNFWILKKGNSQEKSNLLLKSLVSLDLGLWSII